MQQQKHFGGLKMQTLKCKFLKTWKTFEMAICGNGDIMSIICSVGMRENILKERACAQVCSVSFCTERSCVNILRKLKGLE